MDSLRMFKKKSYQEGLRWKKWCYQEGCVCDALREKTSETQALQWLLRNIPLYFTPGSQLCRSLCLPQEPEVGIKSAVALWTFPVTTTDHQCLPAPWTHKGWAAAHDSCPQEMSRGGNCKINSKHKQLSGSQRP